MKFKLDYCHLLHQLQILCYAWLNSLELLSKLTLNFLLGILAFDCGANAYFGILQALM